MAASILAAASLAVVTACGGQGGDPGQEASGASRPEDHLAAAMLLTLTDFPEGWSEEIARDTGGNSPYEDCPALTKDGRTGYAKTARFSPGGDPRIFHVVILYEESPPSTAFETWESHLRCRVEKTNSGALDDEDAKFSHAALGRTSLRVPRYRTQSHRLSVFGESRTRSGSGSTASVYYDVTMIQVDRSLIWIDSWTTGSPLDSGTMRRLIEIAVSRAEAELRTLRREAR